MNFRILINALLIIIGLHILLNQVEHHVDIGVPSNYSNEYFAESPQNKSLKFLTSNNSNELDSEDNFKQQLMNFVKKSNSNIQDKATDFNNNSSNVMPGNYYGGEQSNPNFNSNVANLSKFYTTSFDNLTQNELIKSQYNTSQNNRKEQEILEIDGQSKQTSYTEDGAINKVFKPDTWKYKDELPMNGGSMNGIVGFDTLDSQFAVYDKNSLVIQSVNKDSEYNVNQNDLRKPVINYQN